MKCEKCWSVRFSQKQFVMLKELLCSWLKSDLENLSKLKENRRIANRRPSHFDMQGVKISDLVMMSLPEVSSQTVYYRLAPVPLGHSFGWKPSLTRAEKLLQFTGEQDEKPFDPANILTRSVANVICEIIFGEGSDTTNPDLDRLLQLNAAFAANTADLQLVTML